MGYQQAPWFQVRRRDFCALESIRQPDFQKMVVPLLGRVDHEMKHQTVSVIIVIPWQKKKAIAKQRINFADFTIVPVNLETHTLIE
jgi:hypothetical protein